MQKPLGDRLGHQVVVDNKPGAGGNIATDMAAKSAPDGHLVHLANVGSLTVAPHLVSNLPYDPMKDYEYVATYSRQGNVMLVNPATGKGDRVGFKFLEAQAGGEARKVRFFKSNGEVVDV